MSEADVAVNEAPLGLVARVSKRSGDTACCIKQTISNREEILSVGVQERGSVTEPVKHPQPNQGEAKTTNHGDFWSNHNGSPGGASPCVVSSLVVRFGSSLTSCS